MWTHGGYNDSNKTGDSFDSRRTTITESLYQTTSSTQAEMLALTLAFSGSLITARVRKSTFIRTASVLSPTLLRGTTDYRFLESRTLYSNLSFAHPVPPRSSLPTSPVSQDCPKMTTSTGSQPIRSKTASWQRTLATIPTFKDFHATSSLRPQPTLSRLVPLEQSRSRHSKRTFLVKMIYNVGLSHRRRFRLGLSESEKCRIFPHTPGDPWTSMDMQSRPIVNLRRVHSRSTTWSCARLYALLPNHRDPLLCGPQYLPERFFTSSLLANTHQTINQSGPSNRFLFKRNIVVAICDEELDSEV